MKKDSTDIAMTYLANLPIVKYSIFLLIFSYFYNLPVISYSIKGNNEFRLYDVIGLVFLFFYFYNFYLVNNGISRVVYLRSFYKFLLYCTFMLIITLAIYIYKDRLIRFLQVVLYLYHMWVFFLGAVFTHYYLSNAKVFRKLVLVFLLLITLSSLIVILQNLQIIPYLWSETYFIDYEGFISGTFGPNKIVLGMSMVISCCFIVGLLYMKSNKIPVVFLYVPLCLALIALILSGSRTSYVGFAVFLLYFLFTYTSRFIFFSIIGFIFGGFVIYTSPQIIEKIQYIIDTRITNKLSNPDELNSLTDANQLYEDLGSGRDKLHSSYIRFILNRPQVIPFGQGFINRSGIGFSAHNMYLTLIVELGVVGLFFYFNWLLSYINISKKKQPGIQLAVNGLVLAMLVTLYFGEHLYVYRPLFGLLGLFMITFVVLLYPLRKNKYASK